MPTLRLVVAVKVKAPMARIFDVLADVERYPKMFRYMHGLRVVEQSDQTVLAEVVEDMFGIKIFRVLTQFTFEPPAKVTIEQVQGPFERAVGWFNLEPQNDGSTRLVHGAEITASGLLGALGLLVLGSGEAKRRMTEEVEAVKREAERLMNP